MMAGAIDYTDHYPQSYIDQAMAVPMLRVEEAKPVFSLAYFGFKTTRTMMSDRRVREAMNIAINRAEIVKGVMLGHADASFTYVHPDALDYDPKTADMIKEDVAAANRLLDDAGWKLGGDGIREKNGVKLAPTVYISAGSNLVKLAEPIQGYLRRVGIDWRIHAWDNTIFFAKVAEQDYDIWGSGQSYSSAGDLMEFCFELRYIPYPNRSNWNDPETDAWLHAGRVALRDDERARNYALVQEKVTAEYLYMPVLNLPTFEVTNNRLKGTRPHMLYGHAFYKGLGSLQVTGAVTVRSGPFYGSRIVSKHCLQRERADEAHWEPRDAADESRRSLSERVTCGSGNRSAGQATPARARRTTFAAMRWPTAPQLAPACDTIRAMKLAHPVLVLHGRFGSCQVVRRLGAEWPRSVDGCRWQSPCTNVCLLPLRIPERLFRFRPEPAVIGTWRRSVQRALDSLGTAGRVQSFGRGRACRWMTPPVPGFTTALLLPGPLPSD